MPSIRRERKEGNRLPLEPRFAPPHPARPPMSETAELYQAVIDDHRRRPRRRGPLPSANRVASRENPACGDLCTLRLRVQNRLVAEAAFTGAGCALSQASASLAVSALEGLSVERATSLVAAMEKLVRTGPGSVASDETPGDLAALAAAHALPARHACALLAWQAAGQALQSPPDAGIGDAPEGT